MTTTKSETEERSDNPSSIEKPEENDDNKYHKFEKQEQQNREKRSLKYYLLLFTLLFDTYYSKGETLMHLTLWSWILHLLYFGLHIPSSSGWILRLLHGPSFCGSWALMMMYFWTLVANPSMEFSLAPEGRATWVIYFRAAWLHIIPVAFHCFADINENKAQLRKAYAYAGNNDSGRGEGISYKSENNSDKTKADRWWMYFWSSLGGYFAMGLTWEQANGDAGGTYDITSMDPELYVLISKVTGVFSCIIAFFHFIKPILMC